MNLKKSNSLLTIVILFLFMSITASAQYLNTVYVDATNGNNLNTGASADQAKASIAAGLAKVADAGTLVLVAGDYNGSGFAGEDINIDNTVGHYTQITTGITIQLKPGGTPVSNLVKISAGNFIVNLTGTGTQVTIDNVSGSTTAYLQLVSSNIQLTSGNLAILNSNYFQLPNAATITLNKTNTFVNNRPAASSSVSLVYNGTGDVTAGLEAGYSSFGAAGSITISKASGTVSLPGVTFPSTNNGVVINLTSGNASFGGTVNVGDGDVQNNGATSALTFNNLTLGVKTAANGGPSLLQNTNTGTITVTGNTTWNGLEALAAGPVDFTATPIIDNQVAGTIDMQGTISFVPFGSLSGAATAEVYSFTVKANNPNANGTLKLGQVVANAVNTNSSGTVRNSYGYLQLNNDGIANLKGGNYRSTVTNTKTLTNTTNDLTVGGLVNNNAAAATFDISTNLTFGAGLTNIGTFTQTGTTTASITGTVDNQKAMTLVALTSVGAITNTVAGSVLTLNGNSTSTGVLSNSRSIVLGANTLTLTGANAIAHLTNGGTISGTGTVIVTPTHATNPLTASFDGGTFPKLTISTGTVTFGGALITTNDLTINSGATLNYNNGNVVNVSANVVVSGTLTITGAKTLRTAGFTQNMGSTVTFTGAGILDVKGDFNRVTSTFTQGGTSLVSFTGTTAQTFNPGPLLYLDNLTFTNTAGVITVGQSLRASKVVTISPNTTVALGTNNIILNASNSSIVNNGTYTATAGTPGGIIVGGATIGVVGGAAVTGTTIAGTGTYTNIIIDPGVGNTVTVTNPGGAANVKWSQALNLATGTLDINATANNVDLSPVGTEASLVRDIVKAPNGIIKTNGGNTATFNAANVNYTLTYNGTMPATSAAAGVALDIQSEAANGGQTNLVTGGAHLLSVGMAVTITGTVNYNGSFIVTGVPNATTFTIARAFVADEGVLGTWANTTFPAGSELNQYVSTWTINADGKTNDRSVEIVGNTDFGGSLYVNSLAQVLIKTGVALNLTGANLTHTVKGFIESEHATTSPLVLKGDNSILTGSAVTTDVATVGTLTIGDGTAKTFTVNNLQGVDRGLNLAANAVVNFGMVPNPDDAFPDNTIDGLTTLGATSTLNLTSDVSAFGGVSQGVATLDVKNYNLTVPNNNFTQTGAGVILATGATTGGFVIMDGGAQLNLTAANTIPNLKVLQAVTIAGGASFVVTNNLTIGKAGAAIPVITHGANNITVSGSAINVLGNAVGSINAGAGAIIVTGTTTMTLDNINAGAAAKVQVVNLTVNTNGSLTLATSGTNPQATLEVTGVLTQTKGDINTGAQLLLLSGAGASYARAAGNVTSATGGKVQFNFSAVGGFTNAASDITIDNLEILAAATYAGGKKIIVAKNLYLTTGALSTTAAGLLNIGDDVNIFIDASASSLTEAPTFVGTTNLTYINLVGAGPSNTGNEVPPATGNALKNLTVNPGGVKVIRLNSNAKVTNNITLTSGTLNRVTNSKTLTLSGNGTIEMKGGAFDAAPTVTNYSLLYEAVYANTSNFEFQNGAGISVDNLKILGNNVTVSMLAANSKQVVNFELNANGGWFDCNANKLSVSGSFTVTAGEFKNGAGSTLKLNNAAYAQTFTVPAGTFNITNLELALGAVTPAQAGVITVVGPVGGSAIIKIADAGNIKFTNGLLVLPSNVAVQLPRPTDAVATSGQAFDRTTVVYPGQGHIVGKVIRHGATGDGNVGTDPRFVFPVGTIAENGKAPQYRPIAFQFSPSYVLQSASDITVSMENTSPEGTVGMGMSNGDVLNPKNLTTYAPFYWLVKATPFGLSPYQAYDVEMQGTNLGYGKYAYADLRGIKRQDGNKDNNAWSVMGFDGSSNYQDFLTPDDTTIWIRTNSAQGGLVAAGTRFTIGIPASAPEFTTIPAAVNPVSENNTITLTYVARSNRDAVTRPTIALKSTTVPAGYTFAENVAARTATTSTWVFTWTPGYTVTTAGVVAPFTVVVNAVDGSLISPDNTTTINVSNTNRAPSITVSPNTLQTAVIGQDLTITFTATDPDGAGAMTITPTLPATSGTITAVQTNAVVGGNIVTSYKYRPNITDLVSGTTFTFSATVNDNDPTTPLAGLAPASVQVKAGSGLAFGDIDMNTTVNSADAVKALMMAAGYSIDQQTMVAFTDAQYFVAHVNTPVPGGGGWALANHGVTAFDAYLIMFKGVNSGYLFPCEPGGGLPIAKSGAVSGNIAVGKQSSAIVAEKEVITLPLNIENGRNINSLSFEFSIDEKVATLQKVVPANLPSDWTVMQTYVDGKLTIAMAGVTPISQISNIANITLELKSKEAMTIEGAGVVNNLDKQTLKVTVRSIPSTFELSQNYPNPFNPSTVIKYQVPQASVVKLSIYDVTGRLVKTLINAPQEAGYYSINWDGNSQAGQQVATGMYIYRLEAGSFISTKKMMLMK